MLELKEKHGLKISDEVLAKYVVEYMNSGRVIPGYGRAVLRNVDPRFTH